MRSRGTRPSTARPAGARRASTPSSTSPGPASETSAGHRLQAGDRHLAHRQHDGGRRRRWPPTATAIRLVERRRRWATTDDRGDEVLTEASAPGRRLPCRCRARVGGGHRAGGRRGRPGGHGPHRAGDGPQRRRLRAAGAARPARSGRSARDRAAVVALDHAATTRCARSCTWSTTARSSVRSTSSGRSRCLRPGRRGAGRQLRPPTRVPAPTFALASVLGGFSSERQSAASGSCPDPAAGERVRLGARQLAAAVATLV